MLGDGLDVGYVNGMMAPLARTLNDTLGFFYLICPTRQLFLGLSPCSPRSIEKIYCIYTQ